MTDAAIITATYSPESAIAQAGDDVPACAIIAAACSAAAAIGVRRFVL